MPPRRSTRRSKSPAAGKEGKDASDVVDADADAEAKKTPVKRKRSTTTTTSRSPPPKTTKDAETGGRILIHNDYPRQEIRLSQLDIASYFVLPLEGVRMYPTYVKKMYFLERSRERERELS